MFIIKEKRWPHSFIIPHQRKALTTFTRAQTCLRASSWVIFYLWLMTSCGVPHQRKSADHIHLLFCFTQLASDMFAGKFVSHFLFVADDVICRGLVRTCPCDLALFCKQLFCACVWWLNSGVLIICCVCSCPGVLAGTWGWCDFLFPISVCSVFCVCSCPGVLAGTWGWCDFLFLILLICVFSVWHWLRLKRVINSGLIFAL